MTGRVVMEDLDLCSWLVQLSLAPLYLCSGDPGSLCASLDLSASEKLTHSRAGLFTVLRISADKIPPVECTPSQKAGRRPEPDITLHLSAAGDSGAPMAMGLQTLEHLQDTRKR